MASAAGLKMNILAEEDRGSGRAAKRVKRTKLPTLPPPCALHHRAEPMPYCIHRRSNTDQCPQCFRDNPNADDTNIVLGLQPCLARMALKTCICGSISRPPSAKYSVNALDFYMRNYDTHLAHGNLLIWLNLHVETIDVPNPKFSYRIIGNSLCIKVPPHIEKNHAIARPFRAIFWDLLKEGIVSVEIDKLQGADVPVIRVADRPQMFEDAANRQRPWDRPLRPGFFPPYCARNPAVSVDKYWAGRVPLILSSRNGDFRPFWQAIASVTTSGAVETGQMKRIGIELGRTILHLEVTLLWGQDLLHHVNAMLAALPNDGMKRSIVVTFMMTAVAANSISPDDPRIQTLKNMVPILPDLEFTWRVHVEELVKWKNMSETFYFYRQRIAVEQRVAAMFLSDQEIVLNNKRKSWVSFYERTLKF